MGLIVTTADLDLLPHFERHIARVVLVLYFCGETNAGLFDGQTRQMDSLAKLARCDFWVREPGHLALALLDALALDPTRHQPQRDLIRVATERVLTNEGGDRHRVILPGAAYKPWSISGEMNTILSWLASRAVISDRPSFTKAGSHQIVLEERGVALAQRILETAPSFDWYRLQSETVRAFLPLLESLDLSTMSYLGCSPMQASALPLVPTIKERYERLFN